ncbi:MAG: hypothetical protein WBR13_03755 [Allosphingosinicella sp.]
MSKSHHESGSDQPQNQKNAMSEDPGDGARRSFATGRDGAETAAEKSPEQDSQDESAIEAFGEEGAGIASKE